MLSLTFSHISFYTFLIVFAAGILTSLTPCVYPILPIVIGFLGGQEGKMRDRFFSALFYVLGLSLVYTALGLIAAITGNIFGTLTQNMTVYLVFGGVILVLAGNMMDFYQIPMPRFLQPKVERGQGMLPLGKAFLVGLCSGLVASPCTAPVLGGLLLFIASSQKYVLGSLLMLTFSLGLNMLLLLIGFSSSLLKSLPRSGAWMVGVKKGMAFVLLVGGLYFIFKAGQLS